jgi:hypothetical protein
MNTILSILTRYDAVMAEGVEHARADRLQAMKRIARWIGPSPLRAADANAAGPTDPSELCEIPFAGR